MHIHEILAGRRLHAPQDDAAGAVIDAPPADDAPAAAPAADSAPAAAPPAAAPPPADAPPAAAAANWWEGDAYSQEQRDLLAGKGLANGTPEETLPKVLKMYENSQKLLGKGPDKLIAKPDDPAKVGDWMRQNAEALGLPKDVDGYAIKDLSLPDGVERDTPLEAEVQKIAFEEGMSTAAHQRLIEAYASRITEMSTRIEDDLKAATGKMEAELKADWGDQYKQKATQAQQAFAALAQQANLDSDAQTAMFATLKETGGDANVMRLFATIGAAMGEDSLARGQTSTLRMTPADARAQLATMRQEGGDWYKASKDGNTARIRELMPKMEELAKIAAGS